jgi:homotetrameric cytidine deaminase
MPGIGDALDPFVARAGSVVESSIAAARTAAQGAWVPESDFPVGCVLVAADGRALPGVNVEHPDWTSILCAERNAIGTAVTFGVDALHALYLTCLRDPFATPCGACRQVLIELAPDLVIWMDRGKKDPERSTSRDLLPNAFTGTHISR